MLEKYNAHTEPLFKKLSLLMIEHILHLQELKFYYKYRNNLLAHYIQNVSLLYFNEIYQYPTRGDHEMRQHKIKHEYARK